MPRIFNKPSCLMMLPRSFVMGGHSYFSVSSSIGFSLADSKILYAESDLWKAITPWMEEVGALDVGLPKACGEWLLVGNACAPNQTPSSEWVTSVQLGNSYKKLQIYGERIFNRRGISPAALASKVPLTWDQTWGGENVAENRIGRGFRRANGDVLVPNIELPGFSWEHPDCNGHPASMLPIDALHPMRKKYAGTYGEDYLKRFYPGYPDDCSRQYFNLAFPDQQIDGYWRGDEAFELKNCHPLNSLIAGKLPNLRARTWIAHNGEALQEISMELSTVWFFPEAMMGVLVFHGVVNSDSLDGGEIERILGAVESLEDSPLTGEYYEQVWKQRLSGDTKGALAKLDDSLLCCNKYEIRFSVLDEVFKSSTKSAQRDRYAEQKAKRQEQIDLDLESNKFSSDESLKEKIKELIAQINESKQPSEEFEQFKLLGSNISKLSQYLEKIRAENTSQKVSDGYINLIKEKKKQYLAEMGKHFPNALENIGRIPTNEIPLLNTDHIHEGFKNLEKLLSEPSPVGLETHWMEAKKLWLENEKFFTKLDGGGKMYSGLAQEISAMQKNISDHSLDAGMKDLLDDFKSDDFPKQYVKESPSQFEVLESNILKPAPINWPEDIKTYEQLTFHGRDLCNQQLKGLTLTNCDFQNCNLRDSLWEDCTLIGCDFNQAVLNGAIFKRVTFLRCRLSKIQAINALWQSSKIIKSEASHAVFSEYTWEKSTLIETNCDESSWMHAVLARNTVVKSSFKKAIFACLKAQRGVWSQCNLSDGDWSDVSLLRCAFHQTNMAKHWGASHLNQVSMQELNFEGSDWQGAHLKSVILSGANLKNSNLSRIVATHVYFIRANLNGVNFSEAKIEDSVLIETDLKKTSFLKADLVRSWFGNAQTDKETSWELAQKSTSCFYPKRIAVEPTC